jgi:hypothetical protein
LFFWTGMQTWLIVVNEKGYCLRLAWDLPVYLLDENGMILTPTTGRGRKLTSPDRMWVGVGGLFRQSVWRSSERRN